MDPMPLLEQLKRGDRKKLAAVGFIALIVLFLFGSLVLPRLSRPRSGAPHTAQAPGVMIASEAQLDKSAPAPAMAMKDEGMAGRRAMLAESKSQSIASGGAAAPGAPPPPSEGATIAAIPVASTGVDVARKIIMSADVALEVTEFQPVMDRILAVAEGNLGYISQSTMSGGAGDRKSGAVTLRVPVKNFKRALDEVCKLGKVLSRNLQGQDVTEEYVDLQARLRSLQRTEERMYAIMKMAKTIDETMRVENQIEALHTRIEQLIGKMKFLENRADMSTISVAVSEAVDTANVVKPIPPTYWQTVWRDVTNSLKSSVRGAFETLVWFITTVIGAAVWFIVIGVPLAIVFFILKRVYRSLRKASPAPSQAHPQPHPAVERPDIVDAGSRQE